MTLSHCVSAANRPSGQTRLAEWLAPRGLAFNADKTLSSASGPVDFLGFNIRRYRNGKLLIKPSKAAVKRIRGRLAAEVNALHGANAEAVINPLNPIIRGWAAYYRTGVSKEIFYALDHYVWRLTYRWALRAHPNKPKRWVMTRYFGAFHPARRDRWVFGDRDTGRYLVKFSWTPIVRHRLVKAAVTRRPRPGQLLGRAAAAREPPLGPFICGCSSRRKGDAQAAAACCCTQTSNRKALRSGNSGSKGCARRSAARQSPSPAGRRTRTHAASCTPAARNAETLLTQPARPQTAA